MVTLSLEGKKALVCGSTQGIGLASAKKLAEAGAEICLMARNEKALAQECQQLNAINGLNNSYLLADFSDYKNVRAAIQNYLLNETGFDILINNNGGPPSGLIHKAETEEFTTAFTQHTLCNHELVKALLPHMINNGFGRVVNIISTSVKQPLHNLGVSNTIRASVANWAKTLANETGQYNITVNNVLPGATLTGRLKNIIESKAAKSNQEAEIIEKEMMHEIPMQRFAEPEEIANAVLFLVSPLGSYVNGINLPVDGGRTACL